MDGRERRQIGAHYTRERDILKVIRPLFLDELRAGFEKTPAARPTRPGRGLQAASTWLPPVRPIPMRRRPTQGR
ncbi:MAG: hypothetical protein ACKVYV_12420 [Limisphaerales bacterium]